VQVCRWIIVNSSRFAPRRMSSWRRERYVFKDKSNRSVCKSGNMSQKCVSKTTFSE